MAKITETRKARMLEVVSHKVGNQTVKAVVKRKERIPVQARKEVMCQKCGKVTLVSPGQIVYCKH